MNITIKAEIIQDELVCDVYVDNTLDLSIVKFKRISGTAKYGFITTRPRHFTLPNETVQITRSLKKSFYCLGVES